MIGRCFRVHSLTIFPELECLRYYDPVLIFFLLQIVRQMLDPEEGEKLRQKIDDTTHSYDYYGPINYHIDVTDGTTHLSVLDEEGNAVSITTSINK